MTQYLEKLNVGDKLQMIGPGGKLNYFGYGEFKIKEENVSRKNLGFIAGGTGIAPCFHVLQASVRR